MACWTAARADGVIDNSGASGLVQAHWPFDLALGGLAAAVLRVPLQPTAVARLLSLHAF